MAGNVQTALDSRQVIKGIRIPASAMSSCVISATVKRNGIEQGTFSLPVKANGTTDSFEWWDTAANAAVTCIYTIEFDATQCNCTVSPLTINWVAEPKCTTPVSFSVVGTVVGGTSVLTVNAPTNCVTNYSIEKKINNAWVQQSLLSTAGMTETPAGSGVYKVTTATIVAGAVGDYRLVYNPALQTTSNPSGQSNKCAMNCNLSPVYLEYSITAVVVCKFTPVSVSAVAVCGAENALPNGTPAGCKFTSVTASAVAACGAEDALPNGGITACGATPANTYVGLPPAAAGVPSSFSTGQQLYEYNGATACHCLTISTGQTIAVPFIYNGVNPQGAWTIELCSAGAGLSGQGDLKEANIAECPGVFTGSVDDQFNASGSWPFGMVGSPDPWRKKLTIGKQYYMNIKVSTGNPAAILLCMTE